MARDFIRADGVDEAAAGDDNLPDLAQILAALAAANMLLSERQLPLLSPIDILQYLYYPVLLGVVTLLFIIFRKEKAVTTEAKS